MKALIDADICVYRCAWASQDIEEALARWRLEDMISSMVADLEAADFQLYLTSQDRSCFRFEIYPQYKANRTQPKPRHYLMMRNYLVEKLGAVVVEGEEADDALGKNQTNDTIICTIDKDLDQIPGWHYNFVKRIKYNISPLEAIRQFYYQLLVGDKATDNIDGCPGIGHAKATRILEGCQDEIEMLEAVVSKYLNAYESEDALERLMLAGKLLWIRKQGKPEWVVPSGESGSSVVVSRNVLETFLLDRGLSTSTNQTSTNTSSLKSHEST